MKIIAVLLLMLPPAAFAAETCHDVDAAGSEVTFEAEQAGTPFTGGFREFGGKVCLDGDMVTRIDAWLAPASVDSGLPELDAVLQDAEFFDTENHPRAHFTSEKIVRGAQPGEWRAQGDLTLKGTTRAVTVPFTLRTDGAPQLRGELALERLQFGVGTGEWSDTEWLGGTVVIRFRAALAPPG